MLIPQENSGDYPMAEEGSDLYTVNMESDKAVRQAFAADVLEYAGENGIEAYESITAESGAGEITFQYLPLGIYVIDTAGRARITVMWDMGWQSEIKESYQPEAETSTETEKKDEIQQEDANSKDESSTEENSADESVGTETLMEAESGESTEEEAPKAEQEAPKADSKAPVMIVAVVVVLALAGVLVFVKKKKQ